MVLKVKDNRMLIRAFDAFTPLAGFAIVVLCAFASFEMDSAPSFLKVILGSIALLGFILIGLPSCRASVDISSNEVVVCNMLFHMIPIRRKIKISDITTMRVLRRPFISANGGSSTNIDVEALQLVENTGRKTNIGHFHGYARSYQYTNNNDRTEKQYANSDLFGEVIDFLQSNLKAIGRPEIYVGHTQSGVNYFT